MRRGRTTTKIVGGAGVSGRKRQLARGLRQTSTNTEDYVWLLVRGRRMFGLKFRRQQVIRGYVVDFYCPELRLAIEIDGAVHDGTFEIDQCRQRNLEATGLRIIRLNNEDVTRPNLARAIHDALPFDHPNKVPVEAIAIERGCRADR